jgi:hypothetical protein
MSTVHQLFPTPAKEAQDAMMRYQSGLAEEQTGKKKVIRAVAAYGVALLAGRNERCSNTDFKQWIIDNKLDIGKPWSDRFERSAAMQIARLVVGTVPTTDIPIEEFDDCPYTRPVDIIKWYRDKHNKNTVLRAQEAVGPKGPPETRTGRDGKSYKARKKSAPKRHARADDVVNRADANMSYKDIAADTQVGARQVRHIVEEEQIRREAQGELLDAATVKHFTEKGALRIEDAIRVHTARLNKQFEQRVNDEVRHRIEAAADATRTSNKELRLENTRLQRMLSQGAMFTEKQFRGLQMCCHPDASASAATRAELTQLLLKYKERLTGIVR